MLTPTVGRIVYYRDSELSDQPCAAMVVYVYKNDPDVLNLVVWDRVAFMVPRVGVRRGQAEGQWDWMPYQKEKAAAGDHNSESAEPRPDVEPSRPE